MNAAVRPCALLLAAALAAGGEAAAGTPLSLRITGEILHANTLEVGFLSFRDVVARPRFADGKLTFAEVSATAYDGRLVAEVEVDLDAGVTRCHGQVQDLDLALIVRSFGGNADQLGGRIAGRFSITIPHAHPSRTTGDGELTIGEATLVQFPLLLALLAGDPGRERGRDRLSARFELREGSVHIPVMTLESPSARIGITGTVGFDGDLRLQVVPRLRYWLLDRIPLLGDPLSRGLSAATSRVARASIRGHVTRPVLIFSLFGE